MSAHSWNIIGLVAVMAGVIMLFVFGMPYRIRRGGLTLLAAEEEDADDLKRERIYDRLGLIGLVLVIAGTLCQIIANTCSAS